MNENEQPNVVPNIETTTTPVEPVTPTEVAAPVVPNIESPTTPVVPTAPVEAAPVAQPQAAPIKFNGEEQVIFEAKPEKESNPIAVLILFAITLAFMFFLPNISSYLGNKISFQKTTPTSSSQTTQTQTEEPTQTTEEKKITNFDAAETIMVDNLAFTKFQKANTDDEYFIRFSMSNYNETTFDFSKKYYAILYDTDENVLFRALIYSYTPLPYKSVSQVSLTIDKSTYENVKKIAINLIEEAQYDSYNLKTSDGDYGVLECSYLNDNLKYYFNNRSLEKIVETYSETNANSKYTTHLNEYKTLNQNLLALNNEGVSSIMVESDKVDDVSFTLTNQIELSSLQNTELANLQQYRYFKYTAKVDVVYFEMRALGYTCS